MATTNKSAWFAMFYALFNHFITLVRGSFVVPLTTGFATVLPELPVTLNSSTSSSSSSSARRLLLARPVPDRITRVHLIVLVHGWMGSCLELGYLQEAIEERIPIRFSDSSSTTQFVVYSAKSNDGRTSDGVEAGGTRLANEVNTLLNQMEPVVATAINNEESPATKDTASSKRLVTLTFVGNSLGGLYARFALSQIPRCFGADQQSSLMEVKPLVFCTTATPHLGVSRHTYVPLPRFAETLVATTLQQTGQDLFQCTNVIERMGTEKLFLDPLRAFRKRVAYANAFGTDFQVPTATAAFLSKTNSSHRSVFADNDCSMIIMTLETSQKSIQEQQQYFPSIQGRISQQLDAMGWTKVFCDVRNNLLAVPIPFRNRPSKVCQKEEWTSHELLSELCSPRNQWHVPFGHSVMVANSKNPLYRRMNSGGKPIMDKLAQDLVQELLSD